jgi:TPR repeat protein
MQPTHANAGLELTESQIRALEKSANAGDGVASFRLYQFFSFVLADSNQAMLWLKKAAIQGHVIAQYNLAVTLLQREDPESKQEATKWLQTAASAGDKNAATLLKEMTDAPPQQR